MRRTDRNLAGLSVHARSVRVQRDWARTGGLANDVVNGTRRSPRWFRDALMCTSEKGCRHPIGSRCVCPGRGRVGAARLAAADATPESPQPADSFCESNLRPLPRHLERIERCPFAASREDDGDPPPASRPRQCSGPTRLASAPESVATRYAPSCATRRGARRSVASQRWQQPSTRSRGR